LVKNILNTTTGDTDLDGDVDSSDPVRAIIGFTTADGIGKGAVAGDPRLVFTRVDNASTRN